ncbi:hypothetical protein PSN45_003776 [Yamadazyma tenuis]|uniref:2-dehydropantolactone reductase n=1 Tax=Candida tenuis (strain ATCC 10573 / BCRC 21748 / CBS 615 / JCM 9827 / NBRC 10315 / NRRL Y-1498 / VKM Y-70) TaxID=590646 RepID=G3B3A8_CANTC|nr:Aldo/keto reductase [Yamadazyma tenuis ATCC 10573]XP_006686686.1 uncharacterized protein CANTEDRAFT_114149 [Yamadazyma tenuis ATCC 10573]EGV64371.1 Aldo/keto reductase [Yamadazyma tenuis ATCC 10573]EGV64372.1 hypothetical protein CANTEDRAFT_114149 [Yamadazyma tenuis ATCC 10573]WEJ96240.1 hypothetical protein PSN45_003776 [Yamadazyma tenuis]
MVPLRTLQNGSSIPTIALGCYNLPAATTGELVFQACHAGYRHFDTAVLYHNESEVGQGISRWLAEGNHRKDIFYTSKLWNSQCGYKQATAAIDDCLAKVATLEYIDLLLIHSPLCGPTKRLETWKAMEDAVIAGKVKSIGVSNYGIGHLEQLVNWNQLRIYPQVNQIEISPWLMRTEIADWCQAHDIVVEAYAPLTHGYKLTSPPQEVKSVMDKYGVGAAQVLIRWSLQKGHLPLPKTGRIERLAGNLDVFGFELTAAEMKQLDHPEAYEPTDWECTDAP